MNTKQPMEQKREPGVGEAALTMAIGIVIERVQRLSGEDQKDLYKLVKALATVKDADDLEAIRVAMMEILDQEPCEVISMDLSDLSDRPDKLQRWVNFIAKKVRQLRNQAGMTQIELAEKSGLPQSHISRIELAKLSPSRATLEKIAKAMGQPLSELDPSA